jgi:hypothetical protein
VVELSPRGAERVGMDDDMVKDRADALGDARIRIRKSKG